MAAHYFNRLCKELPVDETIIVGQRNYVLTFNLRYAKMEIIYDPQVLGLSKVPDFEVLILHAGELPNYRFQRSRRAVVGYDHLYGPVGLFQY
jgi:hypothetical protein